MNSKKISGVYAAVLTPRHPDESVDVPGLRKLIQFLMEQGITNFAMNGATGEFCLTTPDQLRTILTTVKDAGNESAKILCGIGAGGTALSIELAAIAERAGVKGLLLPMPYFFPYQQEDLETFCKAVAATTSLPILLYNLPQFTSGLEKETVGRLIAEVENIIGIKDSSGSLEVMRYLTAQGIDACRIVGNDEALAPALSEDVCDGVVSGVACAFPEAILALYAQAGRGGSKEFAVAAKVLDEFIAQLGPFPTPWGLKWIVEARGVTKATFAQPVTAHRLEQAAAMTDWFAAWKDKAMQRIGALIETTN